MKHLTITLLTLLLVIGCSPPSEDAIEAAESLYNHNFLASFDEAKALKEGCWKSDELVYASYKFGKLDPSQYTSKNKHLVRLSAKRCLDDLEVHENEVILFGGEGFILFSIDEDNDVWNGEITIDEYGTIFKSIENEETGENEQTGEKLREVQYKYYIDEISSDRTEVRIAQLPIEEDTLYTEQFKGLSADGAVLRYDGLSLKFPDEEGGGEKKNFDVSAAKKDLWVSEKDLVSIESKGHIIGLHSYSHPTKISNLSKTEQHLEYQRNYEHLSELLGQPIDVMSHPCGDYNDTTLEILKEMNISIGFRSSMSVKEIRSPLEIPREDHANIFKEMQL